MLLHLIRFSGLFAVHYLALATGVCLIDRYAPLGRKPMFNAVLLIVVVILFLGTVLTVV